MIFTQITKHDKGIIFTAQQQPQPQQQNNHNCSWVETKQSLRTPQPTTTETQNYMIEQKSCNAQKTKVISLYEQIAAHREYICSKAVSKCLDSLISSMHCLHLS